MLVSNVGQIANLSYTARHSRYFTKRSRRLPNLLESPWISYYSAILAKRDPTWTSRKSFTAKTAHLPSHSAMLRGLCGGQRQGSPRSGAEGRASVATLARFAVRKFLYTCACGPVQAKSKDLIAKFLKVFPTNQVEVLRRNPV